MSEDLDNFNLISGGKFDEKDLVLINNKKGGIKSGGFDIKSSIMRAGISPIVTLNQNGGKVGGNNVSDLFGGDSLVLPYWATFQPTIGGNKNKDADSDDDDIVDDDIHDKLLELVKEHNIKNKKLTKKNVKKGRKQSKKQNL